MPSLNASTSSNTTSDSSTISATPALNLTSSIPVISNTSHKGAATIGPVTVVKTIELIPQPVSGDSSARSSGFNDRSSGAIARQTKLATISSSAKPGAISEPRVSLSGQVPVPHAAGQWDKSSMLQPIVVGGITYAPEHLADHASRSDGLDVAPSLWQGEGGLPPVVVGGLTYTQVAKGIRSGMLPTGPMDVATAATETRKLAAISLIKGSESHLTHSISMPNQYLAGSGASSPTLSHFESTPPSSTLGFALTVASKTFVLIGSTAVSGNSSKISTSGPTIMDNRSIISLASGGLVIGSSTYPPATPSPTAVVTTSSSTIAPTSMSIQMIIPASPSTFIIANQTFTAYPSGLAIAGTEVFQGSTAITVSGTAISLGRSNIVIGTSTVPFASITGLGAALSSGLVPTITNAPGAGSGNTATAPSTTKSHRSVGGGSGRKVEMVMVWLVIIAVFIAMR